MKPIKTDHECIHLNVCTKAAHITAVSKETLNNLDLEEMHVSLEVS